MIGNGVEIMKDYGGALDEYGQDWFAFGYELGTAIEQTLIGNLTQQA